RRRPLGNDSAGLDKGERERSVVPPDPNEIGRNSDGRAREQKRQAPNLFRGKDGVQDEVDDKKKRSEPCLYRQRVDDARQEGITSAGLIEQPHGGKHERERRHIGEQLMRRLDEVRSKREQEAAEKGRSEAESPPRIQGAEHHRQRSDNPLH